MVGEVHPYVFAWGTQGQFAPDPQALQDAFRADLRPWGGVERMAVVLRRRKHKGLVSGAFPGTFIEVTARALDARERCLAVGDLLVMPGEDGPQLVGPNGPVVLYVGEEDHPHLRAFAPPLVEMPPLRLGEHTPRVEVGPVVLQRERWEVTPAGVPAVGEARDAAALFVAVADARRVHGWPRFVFVGARGEPKPLLSGPGGAAGPGPPPAAAARRAGGGGGDAARTGWALAPPHGGGVHVGAADGDGARGLIAARVCG